MPVTRAVRTMTKQNRQTKGQTPLQIAFTVTDREQQAMIGLAQAYYRVDASQVARMVLQAWLREQLRFQPLAP